MATDRNSMTGPDSSVSRINMTSLLAGFALGAVLASFAWVQILPSEAGGVDPNDFVVFEGGNGPAPVDGEDVAGPGQQRRVIQQGDAGDAGDAGGGGGVSLDDEVAGGGGGDGAGGPGGSGDTTGVSDSSIKLGATYVSGGIAKDFLGEVRDAMEAVRTRVNGQGGVHGRQLEIVYKNDDWDPVRGQQFLENLIKQEKVFALAVSPSSEGLNSAANAGLFSDNGVPVVGADGLNNSQFVDVRTGDANQWIWPVATATTTNVHIIMKEAWDRSGGDLRPAIVFGNTYKFGVEGAFAFNAAYCRVQGGTVKSDGNCNDESKNIPGFGPKETGCNKGSRYCGIDGGWQGGPQDENFTDACKAGDDPCNFILVLLEPTTALNWMTSSGFDPPSSVTNGQGLAGAQPLFTTNFADQCREKCHEMVVWTGYNPPIGEFQRQDAVAQYTRDFRAQKANADVNNQFSMGGYIGMELLVEALKAAGKDLDRGKLVKALNSLTLDTGLTAASKLSWSPSSKYANNAAHGYQIDWNTNQGIAQFERKTGYVQDPWLGEDNILP